MRFMPNYKKESKLSSANINVGKMGLGGFHCIPALPLRLLFSSQVSESNGFQRRVRGPL